MPTMHRELTESLPPRQRRLMRPAPLRPLAPGFGGYWQPKRGIVVPWDVASAVLAAKMADHDRLPPHLRVLAHGR